VAVETKTKKKKSGAPRHHGKMPTKRTINLAGLGEKPVRAGFAIPGIVLVLIAAAIFSKFLVVDRLTEVSRAQGAVASLQSQIDAGYRELEDFDDLSNLYAHYTYSGFTSEELNRTDRVLALKLIRDMIIPYSTVNYWTLSGNSLTIELSAESLQQINLIVQQLEAQDLVDYCTVNTANLSDSNRRNAAAEDDVVRARVSAYLNSGTEVNAG